MNKSVVLTVEDVSLAYRQRVGFLRYQPAWALQSVNFEVLAGETLGIIGGNGAGKSSLLRLLAGISNPSGGRIRTTSDFISLLSLNLGFVSDLSGRQNVRISGMLYGLSMSEIEALLPAIAEYSELAEAIDHAVSTYSAGMKARLGFSIATVIDPDVLLIDEILGVGDLSFRRKSSVTMRKRLKSNKTAIFVSHSMHEVCALCDRVIWLDGGTVRLSGPPDEVVPAYESSIEDS